MAVADHLCDSLCDTKSQGRYGLTGRTSNCLPGALSVRLPAPHLGLSDSAAQAVNDVAVTCSCCGGRDLKNAGKDRESQWKTKGKASQNEKQSKSQIKSGPIS